MQALEDVRLVRKVKITYDGASLMINGERVFLKSAAIHYFRMPQEEWRDVLVKAKLAGMNCIDTYFAWNVHEPEQGQWNFEKDNDCAAFLDLCAELGLWVIARPGPFICAEWDMGGFPYWLASKPDIAYRTFNETYIKHVEHYFELIIPLIADRQATLGGAVILVQVENEFGYLSGDAAGQAYMNYLRSTILRMGIEVPLITCFGGLVDTIEGANFWSGADQHYARLEQTQPEMPKLVTEFWTGWFEHWGAAAATHKTAELYERRMMEALRAGFDGLSHYMFFGGTNFGSMGGRTVGDSDIFMVTSYDYHAPLNEYGRTTDKYHTAKKFNYFVDALGSSLLQATTYDISKLSWSNGITLRGLQYKEQTLLFVESHREEREVFYVTLADGRTVPITVNPGQIAPILDGYSVLDGVRLTCTTWVAGNEQLAGMQTLFVIGGLGQRSYVELSAEAEGGVTIVKGDALAWRKPDEQSIVLDLCHFEEPSIIELAVGKQRLRLIVLSEQALACSWRYETAKGVKWVIGAEDLHLDEQLNWEAGCRSWQNRSLYELSSWEADLRIIQPEVSQGLEVSKSAPTLTDWRVQSIDLTAMKGVPVEQPLDFTSFGYPYGYLLYSSELYATVEGELTTIVLPAIEDSFRIYVNGAEQALVRKVGAATVQLKLGAGKNQLQILVQNMGRLNFSPYLGEKKGLADKAYRDASVIDLLEHWEFENQLVHLGQVLKLAGGEALKRKFTIDGRQRAVLVGAISEHITINGKKIALPGYNNWFCTHTVDISAYVCAGENTIEIIYHKSPISRLEIYTFDPSKSLESWQMSRIPLPRAEAWQQVDKSEAQIDTKTKASPSWLTASFDKPTSKASDRLCLKLRLAGMSKGEIWLNGRSLGRYWQLGPQEDYKIPIAWLQERNELLIFDEEGRSTERVKLLMDDQSLLVWQSAAHFF